MPTEITISLTTLAEVALAAAFIGGVLFVSRSSTSTSSSQPTVGSKKSKGRKKKGSAAPPLAGPTSVAVPEKSKARKQVQTSASAPSPSAPPAEPIATPSLPVPSEPSSSSKKKKSKASAPIPTSNSSPTPVVGPPPAESTPTFAAKAAANATPMPRQTAAEAHLKTALPTKMDDMRDEEHDPTPKVGRVMRILNDQSGTGGERWDEWESNGAEDEGEWEVAKPKKPVAKSISVSSSSSAFATSNPAPKIPGLTESAAHALTKKQRENQKKVAKQAAEKEALEAERLERLAAHRRTLERTRMLEQDKERNKGKPKQGPRSENVEASRVKAKEQSGGMKAALDHDGKLIWE